jgi:hypothetical protein
MRQPDREHSPSRLARVRTAARRVGLGTILALAALFAQRPLIAGPPESTGPDFSREILPILSEHCFPCHGPDAGARKADLRLDTKEGALRVDNAVIVPGRSDESEVYLRISSADESELMPPPKSKHRLAAPQIRLLKQWIDSGARWGTHWAFEPLREPMLPAVTRAEWPRNGIDRFILARLERERLAPASDAPGETLIRRLALDLTGLPPTPAEVDVFLADAAPGAYERLVDRLLASPAYGERMAWDWLDAARYADSNGYQGDQDRTMWPWRDWVVRALNANIPYDRFTVDQLAGDLRPEASRESKLATAFCRNHMINGEGGRIAEENRVDYVMDMAETVGTVWLGLTLNCCRCHDHKFDPLRQRDYYAFFAFFNQTPVDGRGGNPQTAPVLDLATPQELARQAESQAALRAARAGVAAREQALFPRPEGRQASDSPRATVLKPEIVALLGVAPERRSRAQIERLAAFWESADPGYSALLKEQVAALDAQSTATQGITRVMVMEDLPKPRETFVLVRGSYEKPSDRVEPAVPAVLPPLPAGAPANRLALARWLVGPANPLTARVTVNRAWQRFFGTGLVKTPEDFGVQGEKPSHPELLDWLAAEFVRSGWDVKALDRLIATSATYRQSSRVRPGLVERDPENRLLARGPRRRLPSWMIRDQALAASGLLDARSGGAAVRTYQPEGVWEEATFGTKRYAPDHGAALYRRSLYVFWRRIIGPTEFFDSAARQTCVVKPGLTNSPLHALVTLNDVAYVEAARALAELVLKTSGPAPEARLELAYRRVLARRPAAAELPVLLASLARVRAQFTRDPEAARKLLHAGESPRDESLDVVEHAAYAVLCSEILNLDEALSKE